MASGEKKFVYVDKIESGWCKLVFEENKYYILNFKTIKNQKA
jgi:hypothetical protein